MVKIRVYALAAALLLLSLVASLAAGDVDRSLRAVAFWSWVRDAGMLGGVGLALLPTFVRARNAPAPSPAAGIDHYR